MLNRAVPTTSTFQRSPPCLKKLVEETSLFRKPVCQVPAEPRQIDKPIAREPVSDFEEEYTAKTPDEDLAKDGLHRDGRDNGGEIIDEPSRRDYKYVLKTYPEKIKKLRKKERTVEAEQAERDLEWVKKILSASTDKFGRSRKFQDSHERARSRLTHDRHTPKNRFSCRVLPVPARVTAVLREAISRLPIGDRERPIFQTESIAQPWTEGGYLQALRRAMRESGIEALRNGYTPRMFRASFASAVRSMGVDRALVREYLGHSQGDMLGEHYEQISHAQLAESIIPAIEQWWHKGDTSGFSHECKSNKISPL